MSHLKLVPKINEENELFKNVVEKRLKLGFLCRSLSLKFSSVFSGSFNKHNQFVIAYPANTDIFSLKEKLSSVKDTETMLATVMLPGEILGISFKILELTSEGILCQFPENIYQINRRSSKRHKVDQKMVSSLYLELFIAKVSPVPIILPLSDISIHGLSFKVPQFLKTYFQKGQIIPKASLNIQGKQFSVTCEIRNMLANNEVKFPFRVGLRFMNITPMQQTEIQKFILSQKSAV